ncbi:related to BRE1 - E3 ubiquitin ligase [Pseudozyma flocculosa]|uniref:E3 ubiquitin protein ligase n=1 Tax=Pseudozyma flocculosa TaxID=84751 RepID=A0A5C3F0R2_9BASI|nr:related to BRE1 - E3 ubiquitin ligase [Pseudozyma flocculosa]
MASQATDARKRSINHLSATDDGPRKRLQSSSSPATGRAGDGGDEDDGEDESENLWPNYKELEAYRKEAIYRQLLDSRRKLSRSNRRLKAAEGDVDRAQRSSSHLRLFWDQLVERVVSRIPPEHRQRLVPIDPELSADALQQLLEGQLDAIASFVSSGPGGSAAAAAAPDVAQLQRRCDELAEQSAAYKRDLFLSQSKLERSEKALRESTSKLSRLEKEFVRSQSEVVRVIEGRKSPSAQPDAPKAAGSTPTPASAPAPAPASGSTVVVKQEADSPAAPSHPPADAQAIVELRDQLSQAQDSLVVAERESDARFAEIQGLNEEIKELKLSVHQLKEQSQNIPAERVEASAVCQELRAKLAQAQRELAATEERLVSLETENAELREEQASLAKASGTELNERIAALEKTVKSRDSDVTRLRRQRDELNAELTERRHREQVKFNQIDEMKALVGVKEERLAVLTGYVKRLRITIAASRGEQAAVEALSTGADEADQLDKLASAAKAAQAEVEQLRRRLAESGQAETNGADSAAPPQSTEQLQVEVERLKLELRAAGDSSTALYDEIDRLSTAYSDLEKKVSNQVLDLSKMENKMLRLTTEVGSRRLPLGAVAEADCHGTILTVTISLRCPILRYSTAAAAPQKSKADQKFFGTMRIKESLEVENRAALRNVERQTKLVELLTENEKTFAGQLQAHEREVTLFKRAMQEHVKRIATLEAELEASRARLAEVERVKAEAEGSAKELIDAATDERNARRRLEEQVARLEKDLERAQRKAARAVAAAGSSGGGGKVGRKGMDPDEEAKEAAFQMLMCSTCQESWRSRLITKCFHTFCQECVDSRIQTRQRKCPHCAIPFAVSDVQTLYRESSPRSPCAYDAAPLPPFTLYHRSLTIVVLAPFSLPSPPAPVCPGRRGCVSPDSAMKATGSRALLARPPLRVAASYVYRPP